VQELGGSRARQTAQAGRWKYSIPWMLCSVYERRLAGVQQLFHEFSEFQEFGEFSEIQKFHEIREFCEFRDCCLGTGWAVGDRAVRKVVLHIACFAYFVVVVVIMIISSFVVLLYCLYLNPRVLPFDHSPPHPTVVGGGSE